MLWKVALARATGPSADVMSPDATLRVRPVLTTVQSVAIHVPTEARPK